MFKKLSLKFKILMIIVPLGLSLLFAVAMVINSYSQLGKQMEGLVQVADSFEDFGKLIDNLQIERGKSAQYLNKKLSLDELKTQRKEKTDAHVTEARKMLTIIPFHTEDKKELEKKLDAIDAIRKKVDNHEITVPEMISTYAGIIQQLFVGEGQAATLFSGKGIEIKLLNITVIESLKEAIGITRASFTAVFGADMPISQQDLSRIEGNRAAIHSILNSSTLELAPSLHDKSHEVLEGGEWKSLEQDMDSVMQKSIKGSYGINAKDFFGRMSSVMDKIRAVLAVEEQAILKQAEDEVANAHKMFYTVLIGALVAATGVIILAMFIMRDLIKVENDNIKAMFEAVRSQNMIKSAPINIMMTNPDGVFTSLNENCRETLKKLEEHLPEKVDNFIGKIVDLFQKNPEVQRRITGDPKNLPYKGSVQVGPEVLNILIAAIYDSQGKYIGPMVTWEIVTAKVELIKDLTKSANDLSGAASNVFAISSNLSAAAEETSAQANTASVASEEVNAGVQTVSSNMKEMVEAIRNITQITGEAAVMSNEAMSMAANANQLIKQLGQSSMDIGDVIKVISSIAQQTNLLALNATIEAARAGEAGKGFAVVANEVKELAKQTAKATSEITKKIETIQVDSKNAVEAISEISMAIEKVNGYTGNIAAAVEEQSATTNEVTRIVTESAEGVKQINENISQVSQAASSTGKDAGSAQSAAKGVGDIAELLKKYVARLTVEV